MEEVSVCAVCRVGCGAGGLGELVRMIFCGKPTKLGFDFAVGSVVRVDREQSIEVPQQFGVVQRLDDGVNEIQRKYEDADTSIVTSKLRSTGPRWGCARTECESVVNGLDEGGCEVGEEGPA